MKILAILGFIIMVLSGLLIGFACVTVSKDNEREDDK
jgi:hypothetical protein